MNEFALDELQKIYNFIEYHKVNSYDDSRFSTILKKLLHIIDNYCEHKEIVTGAYPRSNPPAKCDVCGVLYR